MFVFIIKNPVNTGEPVLRLKYINGWEWEDIATEIGYGLRNTHYIHSRALKNLSIG